MYSLAKFYKIAAFEVYDEVLLLHENFSTDIKAQFMYRWNESET